MIAKRNAFFNPKLKMTKQAGDIYCSADYRDVTPASRDKLHNQ